MKVDCDALSSICVASNRDRCGQDHAAHRARSPCEVAASPNQLRPAQCCDRPAVLISARRLGQLTVSSRSLASSHADSAASIATVTLSGASGAYRDRASSQARTTRCLKPFLNFGALRVSFSSSRSQRSSVACRVFVSWRGLALDFCSRARELPARTLWRSVRPGQAI